MATTYYKEDDNTLLAYTKTASGGYISRYFNFAAQQVTTLYERKEQLTEKQTSHWGASSAVSDAVAVALTSQLQTQKFSEFDSLAEVRLMREELLKLKGNPPELPEVQDKKAIAPKLTAAG